MLKRSILKTIALYQRFISPLIPPRCRFYPTCSHYGVEAIEQHGLFRGGYLTLRRLLRCHPFHPGGFDPVPRPACNEKIKPEHDRSPDHGQPRPRTTD
ncbi:membrane protein insertion efficiency factor YidD [Candidatus Bipolaricaulota bacterium]|nr:membrane protein insertion efficiency factor YidD [Candidatus Bipolaricaulota bacterium]